MGNEEEATRCRWERVQRVAVYNSPRRARYPSITRSADGSLLVLFTRQNLEEEEAGLGDLVLVRSADEGQSWSDGQVVLRGQAGEPRAVGTMTTLNSGRIIAPFTELNYSEGTSTVRLLTSDDGGRDWQVIDPDVTIPLSWWAPCGKVIETADGIREMPVYGALSEADLKATIHNCGLLRSSDGGQTWGDFSWIARGGRPIIGAAQSSLFSFQGQSVQPLADGRWLAMVTARRLNRAGDGPSEVNAGPGAPQVLCRQWSSDHGRTWTEPDQLMPGAWPSLAVFDQYTLCANTFWCGWGEMRLEVSRDGFGTIFHEAPMMGRGWTRGRTNLPQEAPLPPTVPYLAWHWTGLPCIEAWKWPFEHYGFPSALPLDQDHLIVVFGRTQRGTPGYPFDPPESVTIPEEQERIQAVFYRRSAVEGERTAPLAARPQRPSGRWVLAERIIVEDVGAMAQMPDGDLVGNVAGKVRRSSNGGRTWDEVEGARLPAGAFVALRSGRWLAASVQVNAEWKVGSTTNMGTRGGYPIEKSSGNSYDCSIVVSYSDDQGKTWQAGKPFKGPFKWAMPTACHFIESPDGTVALPIFGCVTDEEMSSYSSSNGVIRSHDGGESWGDFSFVFRTNPKGPDDFQPEPRYSEMDIVELPNGHWVAYSRNEHLGGGPKGLGTTDVAVSTDLGRTWRKTGASLAGVSQQTGVVLPDGGIALMYRTTSWQAPGVAITYDEGRSFEYLLTGPYETSNAFAHGQDEFLVFTPKSGRSDMSAGVYRWVPSTLAEEAGSP